MRLQVIQMWPKNLHITFIHSFLKLSTAVHKEKEEEHRNQLRGFQIDYKNVYLHCTSLSLSLFLTFLPFYLKDMYQHHQEVHLLAMY